MARVLFIVPSATYRVGDFLGAARALGVEVVVGTEQAHALAGLMGVRSLELPLGDVERAVEAIVGHDALLALDAVVAVDDQGTVIAAQASERLGLPHSPAAAVAAARDKAMLRAALHEAEVPQPAFAVIEGGASEDAAAELAGAVGYPCVVKPTTLSGSQGVLRADDQSQARAAVRRVRAIAARAGAGDRSTLLVERFVPGPEIAVEAILRGGLLDVLAVFDKPDPLDGPAFEETLYVTPSRLPAADLEAARAAVEGACRALGLDRGPVHAEVRVQHGRAAVIEVAARTIGGLCARTLVFGAGRSLEQLVLAEALGLDLSDQAAAPDAAGVLMIPTPVAGTLRAVGGMDRARAVPGVTDVEITVVPGRAVAPPPEGNRYLGFVFARGESPAAVEKTLRAAWRELEVEVEVDSSGNLDASAAPTTV